jgi:glycosyltransferase involved in cell wall biosynthesis
MRRTWGLPDGTRVAGYLGRLSPEKDPLAMARLIGSLPNEWHGVVVGEGHLRPVVEAGANELGVADRVRLVGPIMRPGTSWEASIA